MSGRVRILAVVGAVVLVLGVGTVWLVRRATSTAASGGTTVAPTDGAGLTDVPPTDSSTGSSRPPPISTPTDYGSAGPTVSVTPGRSTSGGTTVTSSPTTVAEPSKSSPSKPPPPPKPPRSVTVAGARLDGAPNGPACALVSISELQVALRVVAVSLEVTDAADKQVTVEQNDGEGCPEPGSVRLCRGVVLSHDAGESCLVGVGFGPEHPAGPYDVTVKLTLTTRCTSARSWPCDQTGTPVPTPARPVDVIVLASGTTLLDWPGAGDTPP